MRHALREGIAKEKNNKGSTKHNNGKTISLSDDKVGLDDSVAANKQNQNLDDDCLQIHNRGLAIQHGGVCSEIGDAGVSLPQ